VLAYLELDILGFRKRVEIDIADRVFGDARTYAVEGAEGPMPTARERGMRVAPLIAFGISLLVVSPVLTIEQAPAADDAGARQLRLQPYLRLYRPSGTGRSPALLFVSGCSGFAPSIAPQFYTRAAESWRAKGYAVAFVDYLAARGLANCRGSAALTLSEIGKDILAIASNLPAQSFIDSARITAIGWSFGGGGALAALSQLNAARPSPLRSVIAYYPTCATLIPWRVKVPVLSLMGAQDEVAPPTACQQLFAQLPPGTPLEARIYPDARHAFDAAELPPYARFGSEIVGYNATAAAAAARDVEQFLSR
jgi:dienelactone hydrolase